MAHEDVLGDRQVGEDQRLLVDRHDAVPLSVGGRPDVKWLAIHQKLAGVGVVEAGHDLDQGRLAGTVLAQQGMHFTRVQRDVCAVEGARGTEALGHCAHLEHGIAHVRGLVDRRQSKPPPERY